MPVGFIMVMAGSAGPAYSVDMAISAVAPSRMFTLTVQYWLQSLALETSKFFFFFDYSKYNVVLIFF